MKERSPDYIIHLLIIVRFTDQLININVVKNYALSECLELS